MSILDSLSPAEIANLKAMLANNGAEGTESSKTSASVDVNRKIAKGTYFLLVRLLNSKTYDEFAPVISSDGGVVRYDDDSPVTFGDLRNSRKSDAVRHDGTIGVDYPLIWELTQGDAQGAIEWLNSMPAKAQNRTPKNSTRTVAPKSEPSQPAQQNELAALIAKAESVLANLAAGQVPAPAAGHTKGISRTPVEPAVDLSNEIVLRPGQAVWIVINGESRRVQISDDGKRLNKTVI